MIHNTLKATSLSNYILVCFIIPFPPAVQLRLNRHLSIHCSTPQPRLLLFDSVLQTMSSFSVRLCWDKHFLIPSVMIGTPLFYSMLYTPLHHSSAWKGTPQSPIRHLRVTSCSDTGCCTPSPPPPPLSPFCVTPHD